MNKILMTASALALGATAATAGGIERSGQSAAILFEKGNYLEFNLGQFNPGVSGVFEANGAASGDMGGNYGLYSIAIKHALSDKLDFALIVDEAVGADVDYPTGTTYPLAGYNASIDNISMTALARYKMANNVSLIGGVRMLQTEGRVNLGAYTLRTSTETDFGYVIGAAWEKPEIAARVALTYNSKITHDFTSTEFGALTDSFATTVPESVNLEFQTGVAANTLLFGSVRWVHWTQFDISPEYYSNAGATPFHLNRGALVDYDTNTISYSLGLGRKFNDRWSGAAIVGYEAASGGRTGNLGPTDGYKSLALAATYQATDNIKITGAVRYVNIGDAKTDPIAATFGGDFQDNSGWGAGVRVGISF